jgi:Domain of unknown function (DUF4386)
MNVELAAAAVLILVPIAFNAAFFALGRAFDYPDILRREPDEILRRFHAGGTPLLLRWQALLWSALAMLPVVVLLARVVGASPALTAGSLVVGSAAALVQALGLVRWPFAVPELARRWVAADAEPPERAAATRASVEVVFATIHRLLGVGIGEHLGYVLTGTWTVLAAASVATTDVIPSWLGLVGVPIGVAMVVGALEFVGPNERDGWPLAGIVVPIAYLAWSAWLLALGVALLIT